MGSITPFGFISMRLTTNGLVTNSVDPDQTPRYTASGLGRHCLLRPVCPNT